MIVPNETEVEILTEIKVTDELTAHEAASRLQELGTKNVIITLGAKEAYSKTTDNHEKLIKAFKVNVVDTTAAGDTFLSALMSCLKKDFSNLESAIIYESRVSIAVQKVGAIPSISTKEQVLNALNSK